MVPEPESQTPGRPRDPQKDESAIAAARELLAEAGYQATTIAAIARRAGIGAPTIYRRWRSREALIEDAAFGHARPAPLPAPTGDLRADLHAWVEAFLVQLSDPVIRAALPGLLLAWQQEEGLYKRFLLRNEVDVRALFAAQLGTEGASEHAEAAFDFLVDSTLLRAVTLGMADAAEFCDRTANALAALLDSS
ncbi:TetR/AcrR family transcriptional regulator [Candidatus Mycobacterium wuenschmannii]|uniref:TetR/AcrR family transcriptional regulator n=1 Tax=Candidatus Mycobacterium wuenschmannii TaxID=3027808 RepID=A0ABY8W3I7_9MYCO|nr:TetR/AcrR family transcriptional regulator [Candidatus Mycobacterium wuenschmannii]WIM89646.1 TetR/AcrR family transcriptional regulator [Candidatus Mycobacterium wuenschmannii]